MDQSQLVSRADIVSFGKSIGVHLTGFMPDLFSLETVTQQIQQPTKADRLLQLNHLGRHRGLKLRETLRDAPLELDFKYAAWFTSAYRDWKLATGKRDYTDLLTTYLGSGDPLDLEVIFIDEAQDLSWLQWQVVHKLGANCQRMYMCGDPDQAIFVWAGASSSLFDLEPATETRSLPHSYRVPRIVHGMADKIIRRIKVRYQKEYTCRDEEGEYKPITRLDPLYLNDKSTLVLYRNMHRGQALGSQLEDIGIPFTGANSTLSNPDTIQVLTGVSKILRHEPITAVEAKSMIAHANPNILTEQAKDVRSGDVSATTLFKDPTIFARVELSKTMPKLQRLAYVQRCVARYGLDKVLNPTISLLSIHQSKGREADSVIVDLELARRTYEGYMKEPDEEQRVFYVAVTRARNKLFTIMPEGPMAFVL